MSTIKFLILICVLILSSLGELPAQVRITLETTRFPAGFDGHNPAVLFDNLKTLLEQNKADVKNAETVRESLKGKLIFPNQTTDDLFAFTISPAKYVSGINRETGIRYRGGIFRLKSLQKFPPPGERYRDSGSGLGNGSGDGRGDMGISSTKDLVTEFITTKPLEEWWAANYLPIMTIYPPEANSRASAVISLGPMLLRPSR